MNGKHTKSPSTFFWVIMILINFFVTALVIGLEIMNYKHLRPVSEMFDTLPEKQQMVNQTIATHNKMLAMMIVFGAMFLLPVNFFRMARVVKQPLRTTLIFIVSYLIITSLSLYFISQHYYNLNF